MNLTYKTMSRTSIEIPHATSTESSTYRYIYRNPPCYIYRDKGKTTATSTNYNRSVWGTTTTTTEDLAITPTNGCTRWREGDMN